MRRYNGKDEQKICLAIKGEIFDVTRGRNFYGPGGPYDVFAGREASRAFANFSTDEEMLKMEKDDLSDLNAGQISQLEDWYMSISSKYDKVGKVLYEVMFIPGMTSVILKNFKHEKFFIKLSKLFRLKNQFLGR